MCRYAGVPTGFTVNETGRKRSNLMLLTGNCNHFGGFAWAGEGDFNNLPGHMGCSVLLV